MSFVDWCRIIENMAHNYDIGKIGENMACGYLVNNGYSIINTNYREKFGEIDIIAKAPDKTLVFVEVKTMTAFIPGVDKSPASYPLLAGFKSNNYSVENDLLRPEDQLSNAKLLKFRKTCQWFANLHPELMGTRGYRLDVISIDLGLKNSRLRHYENV